MSILENEIKKYFGWRTKRQYRSYFERLLSLDSKQYNDFMRYLKGRNFINK